MIVVWAVLAGLLVGLVAGWAMHHSAYTQGRLDERAEAALTGAWHHPAVTWNPQERTRRRSPDLNPVAAMPPRPVFEREPRTP